MVYSGQGEVQLGQVAVSRAGRDRDARYLVIRIVDERFVEVADGETRKICTPKRKNMKHLIFMRKVADTIRRRLEDGKTVTDEEVRRALKQLGEEAGKEVG